MNKDYIKSALGLRTASPFVLRVLRSILKSAVRCCHTPQGANELGTSMH